MWRERISSRERKLCWELQNLVTGILILNPLLGECSRERRPDQRDLTSQKSVVHVSIIDRQFWRQHCDITAWNIAGQYGIDIPSTETEIANSVARTTAVASEYGLGGGIRAPNLQVLDQLPTLLQNLRDDVQGLKDDVQGLKGDVQGLKDDVQGLKGDVHRLKDDVQGLKDDVQALKDDVLALQVLPAQVQALQSLPTQIQEFEDYFKAIGRCGVARRRNQLLHGIHPDNFVLFQLYKVKTGVGSPIHGQQRTADMQPAAIGTAYPDNVAPRELDALVNMSLRQISVLAEWANDDFGIVRGDGAGVQRGKLLAHYTAE
jgi:archaellum component FlaC